jgi:hypothetical protein
MMAEKLPKCVLGHRNNKENSEKTVLVHLLVQIIQMQMSLHYLATNNNAVDKLCLANNPTVMTSIANNPTVMTSIANNPTVMTSIANNPTVMTSIAKNPTVMTSIANNPTVMTSIANNPTVMTSIANNPTVMTSISHCSSQKHTWIATDRQTAVHASTLYVVPLEQLTHAASIVRQNRTVSKPTIQCSSQSMLLQPDLSGRCF